MTAEEIKKTTRIEPLLLSYGLKLEKRTATSCMVKCPFHADGSASLSVNFTDNLFFCHGCGAKGSVIDFVSRKEGLSIRDTIVKLGGEPAVPYKRLQAPAQIVEGRKVVAEYSYTDELGKEIFQSVRFEPKGFSQRHKVDGQWVYTLQDVRRVLYNLPLILKANTQYVWICEGEKDCDNLKKCQFVATTNPMGAGKWMDGYSDCLIGKEVILCGDNDEPGRKHMEQVLESICKKAKTVRVVRIPAPHKDVSDFIAKCPDFDTAARELFNMFEGATVLTNGVAVPVKTTDELEREYEKHVESCRSNTYHLASWLPSFRSTLRGLVPGELVSILAGTSVGKTACLQNIAVSAAPLPTLMFELELAEPTVFERFVSIAAKKTAYDIFSTYNKGERIDWKQTGKLNHVAHCSLSRLTPPDIERIILQTELKTGTRPVLVLVDYIGLVSGLGKTRYERTSNVAEELRIIAKATKTIIILASQVGRKKPDDATEVTLCDAKESGSIENSSSLLLGAWRDDDNKYIMHIKVLKNTRGQTQQEVLCSFDGERMTIDELKPQARIDPEDVPN